MRAASRYAGWGPREADLMLLSLPRRYRTPLLLHSKGGHSCAASAHHLGTTPEHVERLIAQALVGMLRAARLIERYR